MDQVTPIEDKNSFLRNDRKLVCSMLAIYGLCILGLVVMTIWGLDRRSKKLSVDATSTAFRIATQRAEAATTTSANSTSTALALATRQANATATLVAHRTEEAQYSFVERFDDNRNAWLVKSIDDERMRGSLAIDGGAYVWEMQEVKQPFYYQSPFPVTGSIKDFDAYVDFKIAEEAPDSVCGGFLFRTASADWEKGTYIFSVCGNSYFYAGYYEQGTRATESYWKSSDAIRRLDWNHLGIRARGDHFTFFINNQVVSEMTDQHQSEGSLSLLVEVFEKEPTTIWFDNFGFQSR